RWRRRWGGRRIGRRPGGGATGSGRLRPVRLRGGSGGGGGTARTAGGRGRSGRSRRLLAGSLGPVTPGPAVPGFAAHLPLAAADVVDRLQQRFGGGREHGGVYRVLEVQHDGVAFHVLDGRLSDHRGGAFAASP